MVSSNKQMLTVTYFARATLPASVNRVIYTSHITDNIKGCFLKENTSWLLFPSHTPTPSENNTVIEIKKVLKQKVCKGNVVFIAPQTMSLVF